MWKTLLRYGLTLAALAAASLLGLRLWDRYMYAPWTRDARVRADVIAVAPDVSGVVTDVRVADNQPVRKGEVLFLVDPSRYRIAVERAQAALAAARTDEALKTSEARRRAQLDATVVSSESRQSAQFGAETAHARVRQLEAALAAAELDLERTQVRAPADGFVTNLGVFRGSYATSGRAMVAVVDRRSFRVEAYFEETKMPAVRPGLPVDVRLMSGGRHLRGRVEGLARAIAEPEVEGILSNVNPTFHWVRLAQRVPVRIALEAVPDDVVLTAGMTCTVRLEPGSAPGSAPATRSPHAAQAAPGLPTTGRRQELRSASSRMPTQTDAANQGVTATRQPRRWPRT